MLAELIANLAGFAGLIAVAYVVGWYKSTPWKRGGGPGTGGKDVARALAAGAEPPAVRPARLERAE